MKTRVAKISGLLAEKGIDAMLVMQPENRYYLSGFTGDTGALLITADDSFICTDFRYIEQAREQSPHLQVARVTATLVEKLAAMREDTGWHTLAFEGDFINYTMYNTLRDKLPGVELVPLDGAVEKLRRIKDRSEQAAIAKSMAMLDRGFEYICGFIKPGVTEAAISLELEIFMRHQGASGTSFPFIIASGPRASLPHGEATDRVIREGDILTLDFGVIMEHYCSDMTRTVTVGVPPPEMEKIYYIVLEAQRAGLNAVKAGVAASAVDKAARDVIEAHGYGEFFGHGTGHGVGLAVHEAPRLAARDNTVLEAGMVVTVEPGIYLPGQGGVRIEDSVLVEQDGCRLLTNAPKDTLLVIA